MSKVLVKMKVSIAGENFSFVPKQEVEINSDLAEKWVSVGHAEYVNQPGIQKDSSETEEISIDVDKFHTGGGYYELPNGEKVRGKDNAIKALEELEKEGDN